MASAKIANSKAKKRKSLSASISELLNVTGRKSKASSTAEDAVMTGDCTPSPLHHAAMMGRVQQLRQLLDADRANLFSLLNAKDSKGMTALHYAAWQSQPDSAATLLKHGADVCATANDGSTPLHIACQHGTPDVVTLLLHYRSDPTAKNNARRSPFELACEFGRAQVVEVLLASGLLKATLRASDETRDSLRLAARNGHIAVLKLLLEAIDFSVAAAAASTALHDAVACGKVDSVIFLLHAGADPSVTDKHGQTPADVTRKHSHLACAKQMEEILREATNAVYAKAIRDYYGGAEHAAATQLSFNVGDVIWVLDRSNDEQWKGVIIGAKYSSRAGHFPASAVQLVGDSAAGSSRNVSVMHRSVSHRQVKKVLVPEVPDMPCSPLVAPSTPKHPPAPPQRSRLSSSASSGVESCSQMSPAFAQQQQFNFGASGEQGAARLASSSSTQLQRHSTSGSSCSSRASSGFESMKSSVSYCNGAPQIAPNPSTSATCAGAPPLPSRNSYHSSSSAGSTSSFGSLERLDESGYSSLVNVAEMIVAGTHSDAEIVAAWLTELHYEEYVQLFVGAGYDLPTMVRMTPEDLTAIGVSKPGHRKRIGAELRRIANVRDNLPTYRPATIDELFGGIGLAGEYSEMFAKQGCTRVEQLEELTWEDLDEIGVKKLGHLKKITLAIKRLKELKQQRGVAPSPLHASTLMLINNSGATSPSTQMLSINVAEVHPYSHLDGEAASPVQRQGHSPSMSTFQQQQRPAPLQQQYQSDSLPRSLYGGQRRAIVQPQQRTLERPKVSVKPRPVAKIVAKSHGRRSGSCGAALDEDDVLVKAPPETDEPCTALPSWTRLYDEQNLSPRRPSRQHSLRLVPLCTAPTLLDDSFDSLPPPEFPPLPSPIRCEQTMNALREMSEGACSSMEDAAREILEAPLGVRMTRAVKSANSSPLVQHRRRAAAEESGSSCSSSETLCSAVPYFAQEGLGTIRQRGPRVQEAPTDEGGLLGDLDCMLQSLTQELDALILHEERRVCATAST